MTQGELANIRALFPNYDLYYIRTTGLEFVVRPITPKEYTTIKELSTGNYDEEDLVTQTAMIFPYDYNVLRGPGGIPKIISKIVLEASLLTKNSKKTIAGLFKSYMETLENPNNVDVHAPIIIKMAFPEFSFEEIEDWTIDKKLLNLSRAIWALTLKGTPGIDGYRINTEALEEKEMSLKEKEDVCNEYGLDPVMELYDDYKTKVDLVDIPLITNRKWNDEVMISVIRKQVYKSIKR
jgi:hypothetical protein